MASCHQSDETKQPMAFDSIKWKESDGPDFPNRIWMLKDLMDHHDLHGVTKDSLLRDLGEPTRADKDYLFYQVKQERIGSFPLHTITLVIKLGPDSLVQKVMVHK
ncbi:MULTISPECIES: hypothetical protein [unclassified Paraflavitalea]|uniref:hypothetical protein n=1 Tax=unclassified Paraflavitalea TaxID=2798305 RepID=UPI003D358AC8